MKKPAPLISLCLVALASIGVGQCPADTIPIPGLQAPVKVTTDAEGVWHIEAQNDFDAARAQGYVHCRDRLFQMDDTRRQVDGTESMLLGPGRLNADIQARIVGLHRAAQRSYDAAPPRFQAILQAYADGVNHCIDTLPLPPEYGLLELTQVEPWTPVDSLKIGKAISASLSLDIDTGLTENLFDYIQAGIDNGFDGQALFAQDVYRSAPMDPASTIPDATNGTPYAVEWSAEKVEHLAQAAAGAKRASGRLEEHELFSLAMNRRESFVGSNEWGVTGSATLDGRPIIANDPHLSLDAPSTFWEWHIRVEDDPDEGPMNVSGVGFPGTPGVILGQNDAVTWGATTNPMDVSDVFRDTLHVASPSCFLQTGALACIESPPGVLHPVEIQTGITYFFNVIGDGVDDNLAQATGLPPEAEIIGTVPFRSDGPIIDITDPAVLEPPYGTTTALVLQYTGFHATQELQTFSLWNRAENLADFMQGLESFDVGSQNWAYADTAGNLAYFTSAEMPLRSDLEAGGVAGLPPYFVRDGASGLNNWVPDAAHSQGQTIPYAVLPAAEMPHTVNPENDFFVNANNDPAGTTLDNDPLNQVRTSNPGAIYYLNPGYSIGLRAGRITRLIESEMAGGKVSVDDMQEFQANTQQLDAELLVPFLVQAFTNAGEAGAPPALAALAGDPEITEAVGRLSLWDYSTPTGLDDGYDASDVYGVRIPLFPHGGGQPEIDASVAATIYNMWRGFAIRNIVDARLSSYGLDAGSTEALKALHHLLNQSPYTGMAAAGFDWIPQPSALSAEDRRDLALLQSLRDALDQLAGNDLAPAFANSTNQEDYRWGKLHRIVFDHRFEDSFDIPPQGGFQDLAPGLRGLARDGGYNVVNASGFGARNIGLNRFMFGGGPVRRYVGRPLFGRIVGVNAVPGGPSGIPGDPDYATQLGTWLTADYHLVNMTRFVPGKRERLVPPAP
jgi:penicillin amidase